MNLKARVLFNWEKDEEHESGTGKEIETRFSRIWDVGGLAQFRIGGGRGQMTKYHSCFVKHERSSNLGN